MARGAGSRARLFSFHAVAECRAPMTLPSDHFDGRRFFNPTPPAQQPFSAVPRMLLEKRTPWPARVDVPLRQPPALDGAAATSTFIGHSTFLIQTAAGNILTDPMYSERASPLSIGRTAARAPAGHRVRRSAADLDDPAQPQSLRSLRSADASQAGVDADPIVVTPLGNGRLVRSAGLGRIEELDWWQDATSRRGADHADAGASLLGAHAVRSQPRAVGRIPAGRRRQAHLLRRRQRLCAALSRDPAAPRSVRSRADPDRRLRAALVHGRGAHEPGGGGAGASRSRRAEEHRHALRHLPADQRGDRRAAARSTRRAAQRIPEDRFSTLEPGARSRSCRSDPLPPDLTPPAKLPVDPAILPILPCDRRRRFHLRRFSSSGGFIVCHFVARS